MAMKMTENRTRTIVLSLESSTIFTWKKQAEEAGSQIGNPQILHYKSASRMQLKS